MTPVDVAAETLASLGWSTGEISYFVGYKLTWQIDARRGEHTIVARGATQSEAWQAAARQAQEMEKQ